MRKRTEEEFYTLFCSKSLILNPEKNKEKGRIWMVDLSKEGLAGQLLARNDPEQGSLAYARAAWKKALSDWDNYRKTLPVPPPKSEPIGVFAERIAETRGKMRAIEAECRKLNSMLREMERQEQEEEQKRRSKPKGAIKWIDGRPALCDGRKLKTNSDGVIVFQDQPKLTLENYLEQINQARKEKTKAKREKHRQAVLDGVKKRLGEPAVVEKKKRGKISNG